MKLRCPHCERDMELTGDRPSFCPYCGKPLSFGDLPSTAAMSPDMILPASPDPVPDQVGPYRLVRPLGSGGMGTVYEAEDSTSQRRVALKLLSPQSARSPEALDRFRQEGRLASQIAHPRCVLILAAEEFDGRPAIVMELMTGKTLRDLVEETGPLPPEQAVAKILDVLDGLQEAHRVGVIHRDVKPSNCFLVGDGRVKVGDFGLAKSLTSDVQLTRTGVFLGTPLFASPEQIKGGEIDVRTDVYALAATLYFLLSGKAPFQQANATATMARIMSEPVPPLRSAQPELSAALERVVLKGLDRSPGRRWQNLEAFRNALMRFVPEHSSRGTLGHRVGAMLVDGASWLAWALLTWLAAFGVTSLFGLEGMAAHIVWGVKVVLDAAAWIAYFTVFEGQGGWSPGKRWLGLRVWTAAGSDPPGLRRALLRTIVFYAATGLAWDGLSLASGHADPAQWGAAWPLGVKVLGLLIVTVGMRKANGYLGLHERLSGSRVVALPQVLERRSLESLRPQPWIQKLNGDIPGQVGPYRVHGVLAPGPDLALLGEDSTLGREVFLHLSSREQSELPAARQNVDRPSRPRWLTGGRHGPWRWNAFVMAEGCPLLEAVDADHRLDWEELRPLLLQLAEELKSACRDGSLPDELTLGQVWVEPDGSVSLLDWPLRPPPENERVPPVLPQQRALKLLRMVAALALEGRPQTETTAPVPVHARTILDRLAGVSQPYGNVDELVSDLNATRGRPGRLTVRMRAVHLVAVAAALAVGLVSMFVSSGAFGFWYDLEMVRVLSGQIARARGAVKVLQDPAKLARMVPNLPSSLADKVKGEGERDALIDQIQDRLEADQVEYDRVTDNLIIGNWIRDELGQQFKEAVVSPQDFLEAVKLVSPETVPDSARGVTLGRLAVTVGVWPVLWVLAAFLFRGGVTFSLLGLAVVGPDGRTASPWRCAWRELFIWAPVTLLLGLAVMLASQPGGAVAAVVFWWSALVLLGVYIFLALWFPARGWHDRLAGTWLVPR